MCLSAQRPELLDTHNLSDESVGHLKASYGYFFLWGYYGTQYRSKILSSFWDIRDIILLGSTKRIRAQAPPPKAAEAQCTIHNVYQARQ